MRPEALVRSLLWMLRGFQLVLQPPDRAEFGIASKNEAHDFRFAVDDDELAVLRPVTERRHPAHPHPLPF